MNIEKELTTRLNNNKNLKKIQELIAKNLSFSIVGQEGFFKAFLINKIKEYSSNNKIILIVKNENISDILQK
ncbi:Transcription-repair coupling factor [Borrelia coriaceae ATCC 43381]|uniref:Transcription-repair coupling factor n=1 Tax=Borrelia coriaceae ATCC 43381 TaxID=1408429 RepID=W5SVA8_9SPIR|nr:Transcription-repair coupling factor [Borrelia coriaceae ATCC 43381]